MENQKEENVMVLMLYKNFSKEKGVDVV